MYIKILDSAAMGKDLPFEKLLSVGEVKIYESTSAEDVAKRISDAEVVITNKVKITRELMEGAPMLKLICVFATGYDNIDIKAASELGIGVCNVPAYSTESVALHTVSCVLNLFVRLREFMDYVASGEYTASGLPNYIAPVYHEMCDMKWGIIGYGNIGKRVAQIATALGARVMVCKRTAVEGVDCVDIDTLCSECDIITIHCPLTEQTRGMIDKKRIGLMKSSVIIVNEARGAVVDEFAIAEAIKNKSIGAFGSDVYSTEPFGENHPFSEISKCKNVCLTPHVAWAAYESRNRCLDIIVQNIKAFVSGKIQNRIDNTWQK